MFDYNIHILNYLYNNSSLKPLQRKKGELDNMNCNNSIKNYTLLFALEDSMVPLKNYKKINYYLIQYHSLSSFLKSGNNLATTLTIYNTF